MHFSLLVSILPRSVPSLPRSLAPPCLPCVKGWQRAAPHSSFPPTTAPLQTLHMDSYTLAASPQHNGISKRRIGLVMEVARTSMIYVAAPHFLSSFVVQYTAEQLNLWPRVSHPETSPTLQWTGEVGDASAFRVWGSLSLVHDLPAGKISPRSLQCVFLGFPTDAPPWQFYHPGSRRVLSSCDVTFDESVCFYRLHPHRSSSVPLPSLSLVDDPPPPPVAPLPPPGPTPSVPPGFQPQPSSPPLRPVAVDSGAARGGDTGGADSGGAGSGDAASPMGAGGAGGAIAGGSVGGGAGGAGAAGAGGAGAAGAGAAGAAGAGARQQETLSLERLRESAARWGSPGGGAWRARAAGSGGAGPRGASAGVVRAGGTGTGGTGATGGTGGAGPVGASDVVPRVGGTGGASTGGATGPGGGAGGAGSRGAVSTRARGSGGVTTQPQRSALRHLLSLPPAATEFPVPGTTPPLLFPPTDQTHPHLLPGSPLPTPAHHTKVTEFCSERREPETRASTPVRGHRVVRPRAHAVQGTKCMALRPSSIPQHVVLLSPRVSSLPHILDPESDLVRTASLTVTRLLAAVVTDPSFESVAASALVAELVDLRTTLVALGFAPSTSDPSLFLCTNTSLPPFYVLVYVDDLVFATDNTEALALVKAELQERHTCTDLGHSLSAPPLDVSVELSGPYSELVGCLMYLMTCTRPDLPYPLSLMARYVAPCRHRKMTHRSTQGYSFSHGTGSVSWRSTCSSSVLISSCEAEIYAGAMAAQKLRWLTYLLADLGERPHSPPVLYVDNKAMIALCQDQRLEHRTKRIALCYFLTRELQQPS
ncbi:unnamed protein product [Closterium sp. NIES-54]